MCEQAHTRWGMRVRVCVSLCHCESRTASSPRGPQMLAGDNVLIPKLQQRKMKRQLVNFYLLGRTFSTGSERLIPGWKDGTLGGRLLESVFS